MQNILTIYKVPEFFLCQNGSNGSIVRRRRVIFTFKVLALCRRLHSRLLFRVLVSLVRRGSRVLHRRLHWVT